MSVATRPCAVLLALLMLFPIACSDDSKSSTDTVAPTEPPTTTEAPVITEAPAPSTTTEASEGWEKVVAPADCMCGDGSEFSFFVRHANPARVMFFFQGGGACFDANGCDPASGQYLSRIIGPADIGEGEGVFDFDNPENPFADFSVVFVPYCTGDVHIGNAVYDYGTSDAGNDVVMHHNGYVNGTTALAKLVELFPDAGEVVVTGESAGSIPSPLYAGLLYDELPNARLTVIADGSGAYPDVPTVNALIGERWGTVNAIPDWPENADATAETWSLPGLFVRAGAHAPDITFARHDYAFDETQASFSALAGVESDDLVTLIDLNETQIEASGVVLYSYISRGDSHTVLGKPEFYTEILNGVYLVDWVTLLVNGSPVTDVHCNECT